jgi:hypothetical protein
MWLFGKRDPVRKQNWSVICFDDGMTTSLGDDIKIEHHVEYRLCRITGERDVRIDVNNHKSARERSLRHGTIVKAKHQWIENGILLASNKAHIFDKDWVCVEKPTSTSLGKWEYKPLTTVEKHLRNMERCDEFRKLIEEHQMIADAYGEFETAVKLHSGIDKPK